MEKIGVRKLGIASGCKAGYDCLYCATTAWDAALKGSIVKNVWFRTVLEHCPVMNRNDERTYYSTYQINNSNIPEGINKDVRVVLSRPIHQNENLDKSVQGAHLYDQKLDKITKILDDAYRFVDSLHNRHQLFVSHNIKSDATNHLVSYISCYYDCMSAWGLGTYEVLLVRQLCKDPRIELDKKVYPGKTEAEWYTIRDFLEQTKDVADSEFEDIMNQQLKPLLLDTLKTLQFS
jgi:excinuclease UvrABC ATPase subunit